MNWGNISLSKISLFLPFITSLNHLLPSLFLISHFPGLVWTLLKTIYNIHPLSFQPLPQVNCEEMYFVAFALLIAWVLCY